MKHLLWRSHKEFLIWTHWPVRYCCFYKSENLWTTPHMAPSAWTKHSRGPHLQLYLLLVYSCQLWCPWEITSTGKWQFYSTRILHYCLDILFIRMCQFECFHNRKFSIMICKPTRYFSAPGLVIITNAEHNNNKRGIYISS